MVSGINGAADLLRSLDAKTISAEEYATDVVRLVADKKNLNAVSSFDENRFIADAKRSDAKRARGTAEILCGLPLIVKDNINTIALPTTGGTRALLDHTPKTNAGVINVIESEGAIVGAKGGMHELAFGITSNNAVTGAIKNPHDPSKIAGGSSGGVASAVAADIFPAGLGTDTGASVRQPAALCGVVGFRPTTGRYVGDGIVPISHTRDTAGPIARSVEDIVLLDSVLSKQTGAGETTSLSDVTLGVPSEVFFENLEAEVETAVQAQLRVLEKAGARLVDVSLKAIWAHNEAFGFPVVFYEVMRDLPAYLKEHTPDISFDTLVANIGSPDVSGAIGSQLGADAMPEAAYRAALDVHRPAMHDIYANAFKAHNLSAIVFPTSPLRARDIGQDETVELNGAQVPTFPTYIQNTDLGSNLGAPGISLPCPITSGLPIGIEFDALPGQDSALLALAMAVEKAMAQ